MYVSCSHCGFESKHFVPIGPNCFENAKFAIEKDAGTLEEVDQKWIFKCPSGHIAEYLPSSFIFWKKYKVKGEA